MHVCYATTCFSLKLFKSCNLVRFKVYFELIFKKCCFLYIKIELYIGASARGVHSVKK